MKVIIVEDSPRVRERVKALLHDDAPFADVAEEAAEAQAAIGLIRERSPDVVSLDLQLADGSVREVLRAVKRAPHAPAVIVLTNLTSLEYQITCLKTGAEFFVDKSFGLERLVDILRELARQSGLNSDERKIL